VFRREYSVQNNMIDGKKACEVDLTEVIIRISLRTKLANSVDPVLLEKPPVAQLL
jgi:hypothetical protein